MFPEIGAGSRSSLVMEGGIASSVVGVSLPESPMWEGTHSQPSPHPLSWHQLGQYGRSGHCQRWEGTHSRTVCPMSGGDDDLDLAGQGVLGI